MRLCILFATISLTAALTRNEVEIINRYGNRYGFNGSCDTLLVTDSTAKPGHYLVSSTGIPNHPVHRTNPNDIAEQLYEYHINHNPTISDNTSCVPMGEVGFAINGVPLFNPLTEEGINAVQGKNAEQFDGCHGHPAPGGDYHYHLLPALDCLFHDNVIPDNGNGTLIGVALDGFPVYYLDDPSLESELDECHGTTGRGGVYRYYITETYPYIIGCFKGSVIGSNNGRSSQLNACPANFTETRNKLCSCPRGMMPPPPGGQDGGMPPPPGGLDGRRPPPPGSRRPPPPGSRRPPPPGGQGSRMPPPPGGQGGRMPPPPSGDQGEVELLAYDEITDTDCYFKYICEEELSRHLWCDSKLDMIKPRDCNKEITNACPERPERGMPPLDRSSQGVQPPQDRAPPNMPINRGRIGPPAQRGPPTLNFVRRVLTSSNRPQPQPGRPSGPSSQQGMPAGYGPTKV